VNQQYTIPCINRYGEVIVSLLQKELVLKGLRGEETVTALFDSGASYSCIRREIAEEIGLLEPLEEPMVFATADEGTSIRADFVVHLSFFFEDTDRRFTDEFIVLDVLSEDLIIGAKTMQAWKIRLDFDAEEVRYEKKVHKLRI
jgi:8-oxo-dGTP pyrophosphatase MutT (NUDIX family)